MKTNIASLSGIYRLFIGVLSTLSVLLFPINSNATEDVYYNSLKRQQLLTGGASFEVWGYTSGTVEQTLTVKDLIWFSIDEDTILKNTVFTHWVKIKIERYDIDTTLIGTDTIQLTVNHSPLEGKAYKYGDVFEFRDAYRFKITIIDKSSSFPAHMKLEGKIIVNRKYTFDCAAPPDLMLKDHEDLIDTSTHSLQVGWQQMDGAESYDLEWTFYDTLSPTITLASGTSSNFDFVFKNNATRITTTLTSYSIPLIYPKGRIYWRIRGVRIKNGARQTGKWSSQKSSNTTLAIRKEWYWVDPHQQGFNWQVQTIFAEEGKKSQSITYFDGSLRNRQKVVRSDAAGLIIASETIYDSLGRAALQVMPAPVSYDTSENSWIQGIRYNSSFSAAQGTTKYASADFNFSSSDCNVASTNPAIKMDSLRSAVGRYYSSFNPARNRFMGKFTPTAEGYPFAVTEFMPDGTGRIRRQGGVGDKFQLGTGHETRYFYAKPDQEELDRLFGNEAGYASHYQKNAVMDRNGQLSVSYIDAHGRTVATALAGAAPMDGDSLRLKQLNNSSVAARIKKDLLDSLRDGMALTSTYSLLVTNDSARDSIIYTFYPGLELSIDSCLAAARCYDCKYDLEIKVVSECGDLIVDFTKSNFLAGQFDTTCSVLPDTIYRLFDLNPGLEVGQYQITKTLKINESALNYYADDYLRHLVCLPNTQTLKNNFLGDTSCNKTCTECYTALGTLDDFRDRYLNGMVSPSPQDTANADTIYYRAKLSCAELCDEGDPSDCSIMLETMLYDVYPGGQYAKYDTLSVADGLDGDLIYTASADVTSVFYLESGEDEYPFQKVVDVGGTDENLYYDAFGNVDYILRGDSIKTRIDSLTINEFITYFKPSWAKTLVKAHPEYCSYLCCKANSYPPWDSLFSTVTTYADAVAAGYLPIDSLISQDSFFQNNPELEVEMLEIWNNYTSTAASACSSPISMTDILTSLIYCGGVLPCSDTPGGACTADNDMFWQLIQSQYLTLKSNLKWQKIRGGSCPASDPPNPYCKGYSELCFGKDSCGMSDPNPYQYKIPRVFTPMPPLSGEAVEDTLYSLLDSVNIKLAGLCDSSCNGMATQWIQRLSLSCPAIANANDTDLEELHDRFVAICKSGCDGEHPFGSVTTNGTATSYNDQNLQNAIDSIFFSGAHHACDTACSAKLIDFPGTFNTKQYLSPVTLITTNDTCVCDRLVSLGDCWASVGDTSLLEFINNSSDVFLTQAQLEKLLDGCDTDCHFMNEAILVPPILECNTCKNLTTVKDSMAAYIAGCGDTTTIGQKNLVAAHLNQVLGLNRTYDEYSAFAISGPQTFPLCRYLCPLSRFTPGSIDTSCVSLELQDGALAFASLQYEHLLDSMRQVFVRNYLGKCLGPDLVEKFEARLSQGEYQYTLYYYDQADNLVRTVPPAGFSPLTLSADLTVVKNHRANPVNTPKYPPHNLITRYWYNSLNQVVRDSTPDRGDSDYWYDALGRLVLSQNAKQRNLNDYTYSIYDFLGRVVETGRVRKTSPDGLATVGTVWVYDDFMDWLAADVVGQYEVTQSYYDEAIPGLSSTLPPYFSNEGIAAGQTNLRNRIATVSFEDVKDGDSLTYNYATHYSYDISGNVKQMVQDIPELDIDTDANHRFKRIAYDYDLVSGKVNYVFYQKDSVDQFIHHYVYDADNRIQFMETSRDSLLWERDANYEYYLHGPLGRTEIGERRVQGIDYAYTLQGWLKGVNASALSLASPNTADFNTRDMGLDGKSSNTGDFARNKNVSRDVVGFTLGYYYGDYRKISTGSSDQFELKYAVNADFNIASPSLYNGNIRQAVYTIARLNELSGYAQPEGFSYKYDQLNRLISQRERINYSLGSTYAWSTVNAERSHFREDIAYDPNGNILRYLRNGHKSSQYLMDSLSYHYEANTNKLNYIDDKQTGALNVYKGDLKDQSPNNYDYDEIGNLIQDTRDSITSITWTNAQKIDSIAKSDRSIWFKYDAMQNRVVKHSKPNGSNLEKRTYYIRDAQGNVMATYAAYVTNDDGDLTWDSLRLTEQHLYGSARVGTALTNVKLYPEIPVNPHLADSSRYPIFEGWKHYEISNHLGNVLAVITDRKRGNAASGSAIQWFDADVVSAQQYYPFGMIMPDTTSAALRRQYSNPNCFDKDYRYGFNGKEGDDEVKGDDNQIDFGARIYDPRVGRFLSVDPIVKPHESRYVGLSNNPILLIDPTGMDTILYGLNDGLEYARKEGDGMSPIYVVDETYRGFDKKNPWLGAKPLLYTVGINTKHKGLTGGAFRDNHPLKNIGTRAGEQVFYEDLLDLTKEFNALVEGGIRDFRALANLNDTRSNFRLTSPKERAFQDLVTDDAKWDLKSDIISDGTPSYAAKVIGEWSILSGTLRRYDDYGNISYGVFGLVAGFTEQRMLDGADLNQRIKDVKGKTHGHGDEDRDKYMIRTGVSNTPAYLKAENRKQN